MLELLGAIELTCGDQLMIPIAGLRQPPARTPGPTFVALNASSGHTDDSPDRLPQATLENGRIVLIVAAAAAKRVAAAAAAARPALWQQTPRRPEGKPRLFQSHLAHSRGDKRATPAENKKKRRKQQEKHNG